MRNLLFCVDSYYQLMVSVNLVINNYSDSNSDIVIFNTMNNAEQIAERLKTSNIFRNIFFAETYLNRTVLNSNKLERIPKYLTYLYSMFFFTRYTKHVLNLTKIEKYDMFFFYGHRPLIQCLFNACKLVNSEIECYRIDDGMGTYTREWNMPKPKTRINIEKMMNRINGFKPIEEYVKGFYVPDGELINYKVNYRLIELENYSNPLLVKTLNEIFNYTYNFDEFEGKQLLYFGVYGKEWVDRDIYYLKQILEVVPREKILIKVHPREKIDPYAQLGIDVMKQSTAPWELFMINWQCPSMIFAAQISSAIITSKTIFKRQGIDFYLYKCAGKGVILPTIDSDLDSFLSRCKKMPMYEKQLIIPLSVSQLLDALREIA